jgi:DNA-directed RNA polymerase specialized sigma24 family protein
MMLRLYRDVALGRYIDAQARRHFSCREDREDAIAEVWEKFTAARCVRPGMEARRFAYRKIKNAYDRALYRRRHAGEIGVPNTIPNTTASSSERIG